MATVKSINKLTEEELLATIDTNQEFSQNNDIVLFMSEFGLEPGKHLISKSVLFKIYSKWSKVKLGNISFNINLGYFLEKKSGHFLVNTDKVKISKYLYNYFSKKQPNTLQVNHFNKFIKANELASGYTWVSFRVLYYMYDKWCNSQVKIQETQFKGLLKVQFKFKETEKHGFVFRLSTTIFNHITQQEINEVVESITKWRNGKRNKQTQDKQIPFPRTKV